MYSPGYTFLEGAVQPCISKIASDLRRVAEESVVALQLGQPNTTKTDPLTFCLLLLSAYDHCFFSLAYVSELWTEQELERSVSFYNDAAVAKLVGSRWAPVLPCLGFNTTNKTRAQWVKALKSLRNCMMHRTAVICSSDYEVIKACTQRASSISNDIDERTVIMTCFLADMSQKLCTFAATTSLLI